MKKFRVSQIQFQAKSTPIENSKLLESYFIKTLSFKPDLICTPECSNIITNDKNHLFRYVTFESECPIINMAKKFCKKNNINVNLGSLLLRLKNNKKLINRSILINKDGKVQSKYDKINLFDVNISKHENHKESDYFINGDKLVITKINKVKIGFSICYDLRFPNIYRALAQKGAQIILIPSAFTIPSGKAHWSTLVRARAIENSLFVVATNMCGTHHSGRKTYGHSIIFGPWGEIKNKCLKKPKIINTTINLNDLIKVRSKIPFALNDKI